MESVEEDIEVKEVFIVFSHGLTFIVEVEEYESE
jgi:hypothetical protein